jgi:hypothetical protein
MDDQERMARNDAIFRDANESIRRSADEFRVDGLLPFLCECADPACTAIVRMSREEYEQVRALPTGFLTTPGHESQAEPGCAVVERSERYVFVEKSGRAGEVAAELDPRSGDDAP